jgi:hypothetical protein
VVTSKLNPREPVSSPAPEKKQPPSSPRMPGGRDARHDLRPLALGPLAGTLREAVRKPSRKRPLECSGWPWPRPHCYRKLHTRR